MRAAFIPALPPSALMGGMIAPSFRLVNRFSRKSCCACPAPRGRGPCCARYFLGIRSLAGGSHTHPTLAVAWAAFAANAGGASVSSARREQETRHAAPGGVFRRALRPHQPPGGPPRAPARAAVGASPRPPLAPWVRNAPARAFRAPIWRKKRGSRHPAAVPAGPRSCAPPGRSPAACARSRRGRRVPAPTARAMRAVCPGHVARKRCERLKGARNAPRRTAPLATPGLPPAPAVRGLEGRSPPSEIVSPGFAGRAGSLRP